ncbi:MAG: TolC family protein [Steroidobacteraceae bacterium]
MFASRLAVAEPRDIRQVVDDYVAIGLASNLALRSADVELERSIAVLDAARARYWPELALEARYSRAEGGRQINFPLGQLLNPVYATLNDLLTQQGQPAPFAPVSDQSFGFLREREQDTRVTLRQPLFAPALRANLRAGRAGVASARAARQALAYRLTRDITVAYTDWLRAGEAAAIVAASRELLQENLRVNESLHANGKTTRDRVLRARAEVLAVEQQLREARNRKQQARSYVNFLLNRSLDTELEAAGIDASLQRVHQDLGVLRELALQRRPELTELDKRRAAAAEAVTAARAARWPTLSLGIDAGTQGERYEFGSGRNFAIASLLLNWSLFDGGARRAAVTQARAVERRAALARSELEQSIALEVQQAVDELRTAYDSLQTAEARVDAAEAAFVIASRKRDEGVSSLVEFIDARNALTGAQLNRAATRFDVIARQADLDYATADAGQGTP